jgi:hypothetical protein
VGIRRDTVLTCCQACDGQRAHPVPAPASPPNETQILFLIGLTLIIGVQKTFVFFARKQKLKGTAAFMAGILLILMRWPLIGFCVETYGIFVLFGDFFATIASFAGNIPIVGPYIQMALRRISYQTRNAELPV